MKSKGRDGGSSGGGGIVIEATNRKARRKEQRHAKKKKQQTKRKTLEHSLTSSGSSSPSTHIANTHIANKKQKKVHTREDISSNNNNDDKRVKFSNTIQEKTIPSVKNHIPIGLKKNKRSSTLAQHDSDDEKYGQSTTLSTNNKNSIKYYQNLDIETATALHADDVEIEYLESNLGIKKKSSKKKKNSIGQELNKEYAKNEGFGDDFGTFLLGLDSLVDRCMGEKDNDAEIGSKDSDTSENNGNSSESDEGGEDEMNGSESDSNESQSMEDTNLTNEDSYTNFDEETALALRNDDAEIAALETKLGLSTSSKARKKLNKEFASTFMGYGEDFGDFLNDLDKLGDKVGTNNDRGKGEEGYESMDSDDSSISNAQEKYTGSDDASSSNEENGSESDEEDDDEPVDTADHDESLTYRPTSGEDIYGNRIHSTNNDGKKPTKYIPPHLRKKLDQSKTADDTKDSSKSQAVISADPETIQHIQRQLNNILNRLSNQTLESVSKSLSKLYATYPFHDVNECLWKNIQNACIPPHMIMSGLIPLYIGAMAGVHWLGGDGTQLGGNLVEWSVVRLFDSLTKGRQGKPNNLELEDGQQQQHDMINKEASNLLLIVCYLYNYGVIHCTLIYDLVRDFIKNFTEIDVESLLLILSHCGQQLRTDDPSSLKEIVLLVKERAQKAAAENDNDLHENVADSSRIQYMVDTIIELKNNKPRKQDALLREKTNSIKKCIGRVKTLASQSLAGKKSGSCLRVTLQDIVDAETKGRWWLVGASWAGNQYHDKLWGREDGGDAGEDEHIESTKPSKKTSRKNDTEDSLLALASSQRMNTDARRSIFCIIMGSTDCNDAFEKLVRSGMLKPKVERDVIRVIVHCCGEEKAYNPYYAHLAIRCCEYQAKSKFTLMLTLWDAFKLIDGYNIRKVANLAKLLAHLIGASNKCLTIGVLKRIEFSPSNMSEMIIVFLSIFMTTLFESYDDDIQEIFAHGMNTLGDAPPAGKKQVVDSDSDDEDSGKALHQTTKKEDLSDLRESLSIFLLQYLKDSPHNIEGSKWNANLQTAISTCENKN